jgi:NMD protein affecting ribosome stability and mRNA decay
MRGVDRIFQTFSSPRYRESYARAKSANTCLVCGRPANGFTDFSSEFEYRISALCQSCQKEVFSEIAVETPAAPTTKECPQCLSTIPIKATKCAHCMSQL